jgi:hypothetical protein
MIEMQQLAQYVREAMQAYHSTLVEYTGDARLGTKRLSDALYVFFLSRSLNKYQPNTDWEQSEECFVNYARLMAVLAFPNYVFTNNGPEISALTSAKLLNHAGFISPLSTAEWIKVVKKASKSRRITFSSSKVEDLSIRFAHVIKKHWFVQKQLSDG